MTNYDRFNAHVGERIGKCLLWKGSKTKAGYGRIWLREQRSMYAHRFVWRHHHGTIPDGTHVCHKCDNPACVNIEHLFLGTDLDNHRDKMRKGRAAKKLTPEDVRKIRTDKRGSRVIAKEYGVAKYAILSIRRGHTWSWVI